MYCTFDWLPGAFIICNHSSIMKNIFTLAIITIGLILVGLRTSRSQMCEFEDDSDLICFNGNSKYLSVGIEIAINSSTYYSEVRHLVIASSLVFDNDTIPFKFLNLSNILLDDLTIDANNINVIQDMAFDTQIFSSVFSLTLNNLRVQSLSEFTLVGFTSLTNLHMRFLTSRFVPDLLYPVSKTIYYLWLEGPISGQAHQLNFGNQSYPQLVWANLCLNLRDSLKSSTFIGLAQVEILELRKCNIEVIEQDTFNSIRERIIELDLRGNQLHQLPVGVFALLLPKPFLRISISDNPFICDCRLMELQILLVMYSSKFDKEVRCASPRLHEHQLIAETTFCGDPDPDVFLVIECGYDTIKILRMTDLKPIVIFRSKELFIEMQRQQHEFIAGNETYIVQAIDLDAKGNPVSRYFQTCPFAVCRFVPPPQLNHRIISVCLTSGKAKLNFSPFQCVSLIQSCANNIWIDSSSKPLAITLTVVGITLAFVFGTAVVFGVLIRFPHWLRGGSQVKMMESNIYINPVPDQIDERTSIPSLRFETVRRELEATKSLERTSNGDWAPHLPPHPTRKFVSK